MTFFPKLCGAMLGLAGLWAAPLTALPDDSRQPIAIQADKAVQAVVSGVDQLTYTGNVVMTQGSLTIQANRVEMLSENRSIRTVVATGQPARFSQLTGAEQVPVDAQANSIRYNLRTETAVLTGSAEVAQQGSIVRADEIIYDIRQERVQAKGKASDTNGNDGRVNMILQPAERKPSPDQQEKADDGNADRQ